MPTPPSDTLYEDLITRANLALVTYLNEAAQEIYEQSQIEVPKSEDHEVRPNDPSYPTVPLQETGEVIEATVEDPVATVVYNSPYATAQHEGDMRYQDHSKEVEWHVTQYTTPGTKKKYLEDPLKAVIARSEEELGMAASMAFSESGIAVEFGAVTHK